MTRFLLLLLLSTSLAACEAVVDSNGDGQSELVLNSTNGTAINTSAQSQHASLQFSSTGL